MKNSRLSEIMKRRWVNNRADMLEICRKGGKSAAKEYTWSEEAKKNHVGSTGKKWKLNRTRTEKEIESCRLAQKAGVEARKRNGNLKWKEDAVGRQSVKYFGRTPWTTGLTKYTSDKIKQISDKMRKYPDKTEFSLFGWTKELRQKIRNRDNWHCKKCGASQKEFKLVLVVHHLDGNKCNNVEDNLITLCRSCHQAVHLEQDVKTGRFKVRKEILSFTIV